MNQRTIGPISRYICVAETWSTVSLCAIELYCRPKAIKTTTLMSLTAALDDTFLCYDEDMDTVVTLSWSYMYTSTAVNTQYRIKCVWIRIWKQSSNSCLSDVCLKPTVSSCFSWDYWAFLKNETKRLWSDERFMFQSDQRYKKYRISQIYAWDSGIKRISCWLLAQIVFWHIQIILGQKAWSQK